MSASLKKSLLLSFLISFQLSGQIIGKVTDTFGEAIPSVNIFIKDTYTGTTTNNNGEYVLNVRETGEYTVVFQYLGFETQTKTIHPARFPFELNVTLSEEVTSLNEVIITKSEDPAYRIIRETIKNQNSNLNRFDAYTADFYSRGLWKLSDLPDKILGQEVGDLEGAIDTVTRSGIIYLSETISEIAYEKPNNFKERIIASKVSGNDNGFSFNNALSANLSFYENTMNFNAPIVSPIATNALNYYRYKLEGIFYEGSKLINKIEVIPRRPKDNVWEGYLYIVEDDWQLYGVDLNTTGDALQIPFVDELFIKQNFQYDSEIQAWVRTLQTIDFKFKFLVIKGDGKFIAQYSNYNFNPEFRKQTFTNELLSFEPNANKKDSLYWNQIRPVPLTTEEIEDYIKKDSIATVRNSKTYLDSTDAVENKFHVTDVLFGYTYRNSYEKWSLGYESPLMHISFNTVQGTKGKAGVFYQKSFDENRTNYIYSKVMADYGMAEGRLRFEGEIIRNYNFTNRMRWRLSGGSRVQQFNRNNPISNLLNSITSLYFERNYMKLYELNYASAEYGQEVINGLHLSASVAYENRKPLFNNSEQVIIRNKNAEYTSNNPWVPEIFGIPPFSDHDVIRSTLNARIVFNQKYFSNPEMKMNLGNSKLPIFNLGVENGIGIDSKTYDFTHFKIGANQTISIGNKGRFIYNLNAGTFVADDYISPTDYKHFNGNQTRIGTHSDYINVFNLLPYYEFSTKNTYFEGHFEHNFKGWILGKIPGINLLNWNLVAGGHLLATERKPYSEVSIGFDNVGFGQFRMLRIDYVHSFYANQNKGAFIFGLKFLQVFN